MVCPGYLLLWAVVSRSPPRPHQSTWSLSLAPWISTVLILVWEICLPLFPYFGSFQCWIMCREPEIFATFLSCHDLKVMIHPLVYKGRNRSSVWEGTWCLLHFCYVWGIASNTMKVMMMITIPPLRHLAWNMVCTWFQILTTVPPRKVTLSFSCPRGCWNWEVR